MGMEKGTLAPPLGFELHTVKPTLSHYTEYGFLAPASDDTLLIWENGDPHGFYCEYYCCLVCDGM